MRTSLARQQRTGGRPALVVLALVLVTVLAGCSGGGDSDSAASDSGQVNSESLGSSGGDRVEALKDGAGDGSVGAGRVPVQARSVISTGKVQLEADDLLDARDEIDRLLGRYGGYVAREETHSDEKGRTSSSTLQLRVPSQHFDTVMSSFAEFATVVDSSREADDVTTEVIDVESRIRTQEISLERLRKFLARATKVTDMIRIESEIARREADLASLRAQSDYLADQTSLATISVRMALPPEKAEEDDPLEDAGFFTGLQNGWHALVDVAIVGATVLGAVLPFLGVLALVIVPLVLWTRASRRRRQPVSAPPPAS